MFLLVFFIPRFQKMFAGFGGSAAVDHADHHRDEPCVALVWIVCAWSGVFVVILAVRNWFASEKGRRVWEALMLRAPLIGPLVAQFAMARFCRMLGTLLGAGVPLVQALNVARKSIGNQILVDAVATSIERVQEGGRLGESLAECRGLFPGSALEMISVAEESGRLDVELVRIANVTEGDLDRQLKTAVAFAEPLMLFFIAEFHRHHFHRHVAADFHIAGLHQITITKENHEPNINVGQNELRRQQAFTLVELLLVLNILGILAALVVPKMVWPQRTGAPDRGANRHLDVRHRAGCVRSGQRLLPERQKRPRRSHRAAPRRRQLARPVRETKSRKTRGATNTSTNAPAATTRSRTICTASAPTVAPARTTTFAIGPPASNRMRGELSSIAVGRARPLGAPRRFCVAADHIGSAFTFIELILVMALLVVMISVTAPMLSNFFRGRVLDSEACRLLALTRAGQSRAVSEGFPMLLWVDADTHAYGLEQETPPKDGDAKAQQFDLDESLLLQASQSAPVSVHGKNLPAIRFLPDGTIDETSPASLHIDGADGHTLWLLQNTNRLSYDIRTTDH